MHCLGIFIYGVSVAILITHKLAQATIIFNMLAKYNYQLDILILMLQLIEDENASKFIL